MMQYGRIAQKIYRICNVSNGKSRVNVCKNAFEPFECSIYSTRVSIRFTQCSNGDVTEDVGVLFWSYHS